MSAPAKINTNAPQPVVDTSTKPTLSQCDVTNGVATAKLHATETTSTQSNPNRAAPDFEDLQQRADDLNNTFGQKQFKKRKTAESKCCCCISEKTGRILLDIAEIIVGLALTAFGILTCVFGQLYAGIPAIVAGASALAIGSYDLVRARREAQLQEYQSVAQQ